jgi:hypothetical protein
MYTLSRAPPAAEKRKREPHTEGFIQPCDLMTQHDDDDNAEMAAKRRCVCRGAQRAPM